MTLASTVAVFAALVQQSGLAEILIFRQSRSKRWINPIFWMSLALGLVSGLLMAAAAPLAARIYHSPRVAGLYWNIALAPPISALSIVPMGLMRGRLEFRLFFAIELLSTA